ncbi:MAG: hypothetical protein H9W81_01075 [Enterococcus sp.]|nr:hypothetical protein [Enterococcus sp.]
MNKYTTADLPDDAGSENERQAKKPSQERFLGRMVTRSSLPQRVKDILNTDVRDLFRKSQR